jgi:hypothetical protein
MKPGQGGVKQETIPPVTIKNTMFIGGIGLGGINLPFPVNTRWFFGGISGINLPFSVNTKSRVL